MPTINDVAKVAGVSVSTVSRILNNKSDVADSTRQHVLEVIDKLGYQPHAQARRLRSNSSKSNTITVFYPLENTPFDNVPQSTVLIDYIQGISRGVEEGGFHLNLVTSEVSPEKILNMYRSSQMDGSIIMQITADDPRINLLQETDYPFVMNGRTVNHDHLSYVDFDYYEAFKLAYDHLYQAGHREIGFLTYPQILIDQRYGPAYYSMQGLQELEVDRSIRIPCFSCDIDMRSTIEATHQMLTQHPQLTALIVVHGEYLNGVMTGITRSNRHIPDDMSLIVISNQRQAENVMPIVDRVDLPALELGYRATQILIERIKGEIQTPQQYLCDTRIYEGESVRSLSSDEMYQ